MRGVGLKLVPVAIGMGIRDQGSGIRDQGLGIAPKPVNPLIERNSWYSAGNSHSIQRTEHH
jgi:hypothetical protein